MGDGEVAMANQDLQELQRFPILQDSPRKVMQNNRPEIGKDWYEVTEDWAKAGNFRNQPLPHPCDRVCEKGKNLKCYYLFVIERHTSKGKVNSYNLKGIVSLAMV